MRRNNDMSMVYLNVGLTLANTLMLAGLIVAVFV